MKIDQTVLCLILIVQSINTLKDGISFVAVGDYTDMMDLNLSNQVFDSIATLKQNAVKNSNEDFDFFITLGDNIYPINATNPKTDELQSMLNMFQARESIKDIPIYPVRGNHDCIFDSVNNQLSLDKMNPSWKFNTHYYLNEFKINPDGQKFSLMHVDSCYLLCWSVQQKTHYYQNLDQDTKDIIDFNCNPDNDTPFAQEGEKMMKWINSTLQQLASDEKVIWKASAMHHMIWGAYHDDITAIMENFYPLVKQNGFDVFFNGHEHLMNYAQNYENEQQQDIVINDHKTKQIWFPDQSNKNQSNIIIVNQGEKMHQCTVGASGKQTDKIHKTHSSFGNFQMISNKFNGFALIQVTENYFSVKYKASLPNKESQDIFELKIQRKNLDMLSRITNYIKQLFY